MPNRFVYWASTKSNKDGKDYIGFLKELLHTTLESNANPNSIYPLLHKNTDKLDKKFCNALKLWTISTVLQTELENHIFIAEGIGNLSTLIQQFTEGNEAINLEIAIAGYEVICQIFRYEDFPDYWAITKNNLGTAYRDRVCGRKSENLELSIKALQAALRVTSFQFSPERFALIYKNLGSAYAIRIEGDPTENINLSIKHFEEALSWYRFEKTPKAWAEIQRFSRKRGDKFS
jgi:tetratricopeptide (TPR) repeat protein